MPNRIIKETIRTSDTIDRLTFFEENFFYRLITACDDYGRYDARLKILKTSLYPLKDDITLYHIECCLFNLAQSGLIQIYASGDKVYLCLTSWREHQRVRNYKEKYPNPDDCILLNATMDDSGDGVFIDDTGDWQLLSVNGGEWRLMAAKSSDQPPRARVYENPIQSNPNTNSASDDAGVKDKTKDADEMFNRLWERYPRKKGKTQVSKTKRLELLKVGEEKLNNCIDAFLNDMQGRDIEFIPYGSTFFNSGYKDYLDDTESKTGSRQTEPPETALEIIDGYPVGFAEICKEHGAYYDDDDEVDIRTALQHREWFSAELWDWMHKEYVVG